MNRELCIIDRTLGYRLTEQFGWSYLRCAQCGLQWVTNTPTRKQLAELYSPSSGYQRHRARQAVDRAHPHYRKLVDLALKRKSTTIRVLDVGCSAGDVAVPLLEHGFTVDGIEPNKTTADVAAARGVRVIGAEIDDIPQYSRYDLIIASEVIEHVPDPGAFLARLRQALAPGGTMILSTPNIESWFARMTLHIGQLTGMPISYLTGPYHLSYFSSTTLSALLSQHDLVVQDRAFRPGPSLRYELGNLHLWGAFKRDRSIASLARMLVGFSVTSLLWCADRVAVFCGIQGFQMYIVASVV